MGLKIGDKIQCSSQDEMLDLFSTLAKEGIMTDWMSITSGDKCKYILTVTDIEEEMPIYWTNITEMYNKQRSKGRHTYGQVLEKNDIPDVLERIEYLQEELIDGLMYCEWIKDRLRGKNL